MRRGYRREGGEGPCERHAARYARQLSTGLFTSASRFPFRV